MGITKTSTPLVAIRCITYNHEPYIRDCLDGFVMQKTDFPFVAIVHDDASTDGTTNIIREYAKKYPDIIKPIFETENQYSKGVESIMRIMRNALIDSGASYIAMCEGDDYWTDPLKLQKQVDYLESHPDVGMVYSDFNIKDETTGKFYPSNFKNNPKRFRQVYPDVASFILAKGYVAPPSWMYRKELLPDNSILSCDGTFVFFSHFLAVSKVHAFDDTMVTYRKLRESASHSANIDNFFRRSLNLLKTQYALIDKYGLNPDLKKVVRNQYYKDILVRASINNRKELVEECRENIENQSLRDKIVFILNDYCPGFLRFIDKIR